MGLPNRVEVPNESLHLCLLEDEELVKRFEAVR